MATAKAKKTRAVPRKYDTAQLGDEPVWAPGESPTALKLGQAFNWYNYFYEHKTAVKLLFDNYPRDKREIKLLKKLPDWKFKPTFCYLARIQALGASLSPRHVTELNNHITDLLAEARGRQKAEEKTKAPVISIQDRMAAKLNEELLGDIEGAIDAFLKEGTGFDAYAWLVSKDVKPLYASLMADTYRPLAAELEEALLGECEQLKEGYLHMGKRKLKAYHAFVESLISDMALYADSKKKAVASKKPRKSRKPKDVGKTKLVSKLKYQVECKEHKVASIAPEKVVGAQVVYTYNTKANQLRIITAATRDGLGVKGTTITNIDPEKTLYKQFKKNGKDLTFFVKGGKLALWKGFKGINTVAKPGHGRMNDKCVILCAIN